MTDEATRAAAWDDIQTKLERIPPEHFRRAVMLATVGSTAHGVSVSTTGATGDDLDLMGVYVPSREDTYGLHEAKSITWRTKPEGERSEAGDIDLTMHVARKFLHLAYKGNPTILAMLASPEQHVDTEIAAILCNSLPMFFSVNAGYAFRGYAEQQFQRLMGERGQMSVKRPELITAYGYDTKYAAHVLRLCHQGETMLREGRFPMPVDDEERAYILAVRRGAVTFDDCALMLREYRARLDVALEETRLPRLPDAKKVNTLILSIYESEWA